MDRNVRVYIFLSLVRLRVRYMHDIIRNGSVAARAANTESHLFGTLIAFVNISMLLKLMRRK